MSYVCNAMTTAQLITEFANEILIFKYLLLILHSFINREIVQYE